MKKIAAITALLTFFWFHCHAQRMDTLVVRGYYQGKGVYVQQLSGDDDCPNFCVTGVLVNGETPPEHGSAFEIVLNNGRREIGDPLEIKIIHRTCCKPKIINPEVLLPLSTYEIISITADSNGLLNWTSKNETGQSVYVVEQFRWNKWIPAGEVNEKSDGENNYTFQTTPHSGKNTFRLKQMDHSGVARYSEEVSFTSQVAEVKILDTLIRSQLIFSAETRYEVYDAYGNILKKGYGIDIDFSNLNDTYYFINFDNQNRMVQKTKKKIQPK